MDQKFQISTQDTGEIINQTKKHLSYEVGRSVKSLAYDHGIVI